MPRPPLVIGTWGRINRIQRGRNLWVAYARFRDHDGHTRQLERTGITGQKAEDALKRALIERLSLDSDDITPDSTISRVSAEWFDSEVDGMKAANTVLWYRHAIADIIDPGIGGVRLREVTVSRLDRFLKTVADTRGPGSAKTTKTVLSGVLGLAARKGAIDRNPLRDVSPIKRKPREDVRVLDLEQLHGLRRRMYADTLAVHRDLVEPIDYMLATGVRIGEMLALRWFDLNLDAEPPTALVRATVVGNGIQEYPKSPTSRRSLTLPSWAVDMLRDRQANARPNDLDLVFPSARGTVRDASNVRRQWRELRTTLGLEWVKPHTFRKSIATLIGDVDDAGSQLGHADTSTTRVHYIPKTHRGPDVRPVLDQIAEPAFTQRKPRRTTATTDRDEASAAG